MAILSFAFWPDGSSLGELLASTGFFGEADVNMVVGMVVEFVVDMVVDLVVEFVVDVVVDIVLGESSGKLMRIFKGNFSG